jgi:hypothetical protein
MIHVLASSNNGMVGWWALLEFLHLGGFAGMIHASGGGFSQTLYNKWEFVHT